MSVSTVEIVRSVEGGANSSTGKLTSCFSRAGLIFSGDRKKKCHIDLISPLITQHIQCCSIYDRDGPLAIVTKTSVLIVFTPFSFFLFILKTISSPWGGARDFLFAP